MYQGVLRDAAMNAKVSWLDAQPTYGVVVIPVGTAGVVMPGCTDKTPVVALIWKMDTQWIVIVAYRDARPTARCSWPTAAWGRLTGCPGTSATRRR